MDKAAKKADKLSIKNKIVADAFDLPAREVVIQDYSCSLHLKFLPTMGRLYILPNYICFVGSFDKKVREIVSYRRVTAVEPARFGLIPNAIRVFFDDGKCFYFSGLSHRNETFYLIHHLFSFPASFTSRLKKPKKPKLTPEEIQAAEELEKRLLLGAAVQSAPTTTATATVSTTTTTSSSTTTTSATPTPKQLVEVDVKTSSEAKALVQQIRELATETLAELNDQAKIIDEMSADVEHIDGAAKRGAEHVKAVQSVFGGSSTSSAESEHDKIEDDRRRIAAERVAERERFEKALRKPMSTVSILFKHKNDLLSPALLLFDDVQLRCVDVKAFVQSKARNAGRATAEPPPLCEAVPYSSVSCVVVRARPFHVDVRLIGGRRVRLMSALIQNVVIELAQRAELPRDGGVVFEPNVRRFKVFESDPDDLGDAADADADRDASARVPCAASSASAHFVVPESRDDSVVGLSSSSSSSSVAETTSRKHSSARDVVMPTPNAEAMAKGVVHGVDDDGNDDKYEDDGDDTTTTATTTTTTTPTTPTTTTSQPANTQMEFVRRKPAVATTHGISDVKTRVALAKQDADVDEISEVLSELKLVATVMERELERQTEQLAKLTSQTETTQSRTNRNVETIDDMISYY